GTRAARGRPLVVRAWTRADAAGLRDPGAPSGGDRGTARGRPALQPAVDAPPRDRRAARPARLPAAVVAPAAARSLRRHAVGDRVRPRPRLRPHADALGAARRRPASRREAAARR